MEINPFIVSLIMLAWGIAVKYFPTLKEWPNRLIWLMNIAIGILAKLIAPDTANASGLGDTLTSSLGWLIVPLQAIAARQLYETFLRPTLEHFGILGYPATPVAGGAAKLRPPRARRAR